MSVFLLTSSWHLSFPLVLCCFSKSRQSASSKYGLFLLLLLSSCVSAPLSLSLTKLGPCISRLLLNLHIFFISAVLSSARKSGVCMSNFTHKENSKLVLEEEEEEEEERK